jgi:thioredoxin-like negative regulator of GroEL
VDVDENLNLATLFRVETLPTVILFEDGLPVHRAVGLQSESDLTKIIGTVPVEVPKEAVEKTAATAEQEDDALKSLMDDFG